MKAHEIVLVAEREVAFDSPDHLHPHGTRQDNSRNRRFNEKLYRLFGAQRSLRILDIGCSGGGFVKDCLDDGHFAVGLEGSDYSKKNRRAEWAIIPERLFTCDVTRPFQLKLADGTQSEDLKFDVVTSWEILEHIPEESLEELARNVERHLLQGGLWITSVCPTEDVVNGVRLHLTVHEKDWWVRRFQDFGWTNLSEHMEYFHAQFVRGKKFGAPDSFNLVLSRDSAHAPSIPAVSLRTCVLDRWIGSRPQRLLRRLVVGE